MHSFRIIIASLFVAVCTIANLQAATYKCQTVSGRVSFSDRPCAANEVSVTIKSDPVSASAHADDRANIQSQHNSANQPDKLLVPDLDELE